MIHSFEHNLICNYLDDPGNVSWLFMIFLQKQTKERRNGNIFSEEFLNLLTDWYLNHQWNETISKTH